MLLLLAAQRVRTAPRPICPQPAIVRRGPVDEHISYLRLETKVEAFKPVINAFGPQLNVLRTWLASPYHGVQVRVELQPKLGEEGYRIELGATSKILAGSRTGLAWALQTLRQLNLQQAVVVEDHPQVAFRAVSLDVARRFYPWWSLKSLIDDASFAKVRFVSLHLTDDQNFMFPSREFRDAEQHNASGHPAYTEPELKALDTYAADRGVTLIPEVDIPGHSQQLAAVHPELRIAESDSQNCLNFASPVVRHKLANLIREEARLFPHSPYIHLGGDEAWYPNAEKNPYFRTAMARLGPKATPEDVFVDFLAAMAHEVRALHREPLVWEGFAKSPFAVHRLAGLVTVIAWSGNGYPAKKLLTDGFRVVNAGWDPYYVVNHFPYDVDTLAPLPDLYHADYHRFGVFDGSVPTFTWPDDPNLRGAMLCWWEGPVWNALDLLPSRILALGASLWRRSGQAPQTTLQVGPGFLADPVPEWTSRMGGSIHFPATELSHPGRTLFVDRFVIPFDTFEYPRWFVVPADGWALKGGREWLSESKALVMFVRHAGQESPVALSERYFQKVGFKPSLTLNCPVTATGPIDPQFPPAFVTDGVTGDTSHYWLAYPCPQTLTVELHTVEIIRRLEVVTCWAAHTPSRYRISLSSDGREFRTVVDASKQTAPSTMDGYVHRIAPTQARYIRFEALGGDLFPATMGRLCQIRAYSD